MLQSERLVKRLNAKASTGAVAGGHMFGKTRIGTQIQAIRKGWNTKDAGISYVSGFSASKASIGMNGKHNIVAPCERTQQTSGVV